MKLNFYEFAIQKMLRRVNVSVRTVFTFLGNGRKSRAGSDKDEKHYYLTETGRTQRPKQPDHALSDKLPRCRIQRDSPMYFLAQLQAIERSKQPIVYACVRTENGKDNITSPFKDCQCVCEDKLLSPEPHQEIRL